MKIRTNKKEVEEIVKEVIEIVLGSHRLHIYEWEKNKRHELFLHNKNSKR